jgi:group II intron reverse transcriptase/maturase
MYVLTKQQRIAEMARRSPQMGFTSLAYLMDIEWLIAAFHRTRKDGAPGVDGQTRIAYERDLEANLQSLLDRAKSGTYRAPPVRRVYIPKAGSDTETRPIGIPTLEDKVLQRAVVMLLEPIYEQDFDAGSYGFRPGRSAHDALEDIWKRTMDSSGGWILEVDIRKFFDTLDRAHLREFLQLRVRDGVLKRLIGKWLKAGVLESGSVSYPDAGTPQGGVISPLLANVFLHYVLDVWFREEVQPRLRGRAHLIRYADDFVIVFTHEEDARRVTEVLPKRFGKYGLTLHPDKTRLISFRRPPRKADSGADNRDDQPGTFDFLGFTHYWGRTRRGGWAVMRKTAANRVSRAVRSITQWCRNNRHRPVGEQHTILSQKVRGHYAYYGITGNILMLRGFLQAVHRAWRKWLDRRNRQREMTWDRFNRLLKRYWLPPPRIVHSYVK